MNQAVDQLVDGLTRFRIDLSYDGTDFTGWAKQPGLRTVHGEFVAVMNKIFGPSETDFSLRVAGRTDAGVHAEHQVVHVDLSPAQLKRLGRNPDMRLKMNALLDPDMRPLIAAIVTQSLILLVAGTRCEPDITFGSNILWILRLCRQLAKSS